MTKKPPIPTPPGWRLIATPNPDFEGPRFHYGGAVEVHFRHGHAAIDPDEVVHFDGRDGGTIVPLVELLTRDGGYADVTEDYFPAPAPAPSKP